MGDEPRVGRRRVNRTSGGNYSILKSSPACKESVSVQIVSIEDITPNLPLNFGINRTRRNQSCAALDVITTSLWGAASANEVDGFDDALSQAIRRSHQQRYSRLINIYSWTIQIKNSSKTPMLMTLMMFLDLPLKSLPLQADNLRICLCIVGVGYL